MPLQENTLFGGFDRDIEPFNLEYIPKKIELIQFMNELN